MGDRCFFCCRPMFPYEVEDIVSHASRCRVQQCQYPRCRHVTGLLFHGSRCQVRVPGGCVLCRKMWLLLYHHALPCKRDQCHVPRCSDIKEKVRNDLQATQEAPGA